MSGLRTNQSIPWVRYFFRFIAAGFFVYMRFHFALSPLEQFYLPTYIKTDIASIVPTRSRFQMLLVSDGKGRAWYAREEDVEAGSTPQLNAKPIPLVMSNSARHRGMVLLYRGAPSPIQPNSVQRYLRQQVYDGQSLGKIFQLPLLFGGLSFLLQLPFSIPKDIRRRKEMKYGRRLKGPVLVSPSNSTRPFEEPASGSK